MNDREIQKNIKISFLMKPLSMFLTFLYMPIALSFLGMERYGVWTIILDVLAWITYFDIGVGNGLRNKLAEAYSLGNNDDCKKYISTAYVVTAAVSFVFCAVFLVLWSGLNLTTRFNLSVGGNETDIAIIISVVFAAINFVMGLVGTILYAIQKNGYLSIINVIQQALQLILIWALNSFMEADLIIIALVYGFANSIIYLIYSFVLFYNKSELKPNIKNVKKQYVRPLLSLGIGFFIMQISSMILNTTDNLLISGLFGKGEVSIYSILYKCFYAFVQLHAIIIMPLWSAYTAANAHKNIDWMKKTIKKINYITVFLTILIVVAVFLFKPFVYIWFNKVLVYDSRLIIFVAVYMVTQMFANNYSSFLCGVGDIRISVVLSLLGAILNIPLSILLADKFGWGLLGIIGGSLFIMLLNCIVLPIVTHNWFRKRKEYSV